MIEQTIVLVLSLGVLIAQADLSCRFALKYQTADILNNATVREQFLLEHARMERHFVRDVGIDNSTMMTLDGHRLNITTGFPIGPGHRFSAPSKESIHVGVLAKVLLGDNVASQLYTVDEALEVLGKKVRSYEKFNAEYPGFGGFFPWTAFDLKGNIAPTWDWQNRVPALDNGELFWAAFAVAHILKERYPHYQDLQFRWDGVWTRMVANAVAVFYAGDGWIRTVSHLTNQSQPVAQNTYTGNGRLADPYEGELFTDMVYLFSELPENEKELLWINKRAMLQRVSLSVTANRSIDVERGFWYSAHEKWKYLMLPYLDSRTNRAVFLNGERARAKYARLINATGMWASVNGPIPANRDNFPYYSDCGIGSLAFEPVTHDMVVTPYSAFPLLLAHPAVGAAWLHHMLLARKAQNCFGTTESMNVTGADIAPLTTWDSKITTVLAATGGLSAVNREILARIGVLANFTARIEHEWSLVFPLPLAGADFEFDPPQEEYFIPRLLDDFTTCSETSPPCSYQ